MYPPYLTWYEIHTFVFTVLHSTHTPELDLGQGCWWQVTGHWWLLTPIGGLHVGVLYKT